MQRRTPMPRGGPLVRRTPLASTTGLTRTPMRRGQPQKRRAGTVNPSNRPDPVTAAVRTLVHARSGDCCELCGTPLRAGWRSIQHRQRRSQGGRHSVVNLLDVCGPNASAGCHHAADEGPNRLVNGHQVPRGVDPASVPVRLAGGRWVLLTAKGGYAGTVGPGSDVPISGGVVDDP